MKKSCLPFLMILLLLAPGLCAQNILNQEAPQVVLRPSIPAASAGVTIMDLIEQVDQALVQGYLQDLVAFGPRVTGTSACLQAGQYIYDRFLDMGLSVRSDSWSTYGYSGTNIEGTLYDQSGTNDEIFLVCAHYDSVPGSPGADDNASGTAAVLALAEVLSAYTFDCNIRFVAFDGEEQGLLGSGEYVEEAFYNGDNIKAAINADMIGFALSPYDETVIKVYDDGSSAWITELSDLAARRFFGQIGIEVLFAGYTWGSDHNSFWDYGYNAVFYHEYNFNDYYHSSQDTIAHMNLAYFTNCTRLMLAALAELSDGFDPLPLEADAYRLSYRSGGAVRFALDAGAANGSRYYLILGSLSGTSPGIPLPGGTTVLPINWDSFTDTILSRLNTSLFADFLGVLDGQGHASAQLATGPLTSKWLGKEMRFAYCLEGPPWDYASNPATVEVVP